MLDFKIILGFESFLDLQMLDQVIHLYGWKAKESHATFMLRLEQFCH